MQTFESVRNLYTDIEIRFVETLMANGMIFAGTVNHNDERLTTISSSGGDVILSSSGKIELFTDSRNPYEPYDCGYDLVFLPDDVTEAEMLASHILRRTGDERG